MKGLKLHIVSRKASDTTSDVAVFLKIHKKGTSAKYYLGLSVPPDRWNRESQRLNLPPYPRGSDAAAKQRRKYYNHLDNLNTKIKYVISRASDLYDLAEDAQDLKRLLDQDRKGGQKQRAITQSLSSALRLWVETHEAYTKAGKKGAKAASTIKNYKSFEKFLNSFKGLHRNSLRAFDDAFYVDWVDELGVEYEFMPNTIGTKIKLLKTFLNWCIEQAYDVNLDFRKYKKLSEERFFVTLTVDELKKIGAVEGYYTGVRDAFLLGCYCGLRYSDLKNIQPENITEEYINVRIQKTRKLLSVPITPPMRPYIKSLIVASNPVMNREIKEIAKRAGIDDNIRIESSGGDEIRPKYELITMHTARRSFITNMVRGGLSHQYIMNATGITQLKTLHRYINLSPQDTGDKVKATWERLL